MLLMLYTRSKHFPSAKMFEWRETGCPAWCIMVQRFCFLYTLSIIKSWHVSPTISWPLIYLHIYLFSASKSIAEDWNSHSGHVSVLLHAPFRSLCWCERSQPQRIRPTCVGVSQIACRAGWTCLNNQFSLSFRDLDFLFKWQFTWVLQRLQELLTQFILIDHNYDVTYSPKT